MIRSFIAIELPEGIRHALAEVQKHLKLNVAGVRWVGAGSHEAGLQAGLAVAEQLGGVTRPWAVANASGRIHVHDRLPEGTVLEAAE